MKSNKENNEQYWHCPYCGKDQDRTNRVCESCGEDLGLKGQMRSRFTDGNNNGNRKKDKTEKKEKRKVEDTFLMTPITIMITVRH